MEAGAAVLEVVVVVGDQMAVDPGLPEQVGQVVVEGLERAPGAVQEVEPPGLHVAPCRHAGHAADEMPLEGDAPLRQPIEIGRRDLAAAIGAENVAVERIEEEINETHGSGTPGRARQGSPGTVTA